MEVSLINCTEDAAELLIFTKHTRLGLSVKLLSEIYEWEEKRKLKELEYISNTIPSSWEFVDYTFLLEEVSRGFTHQFVRTRTNSYAQQSMRVNNMEGFNYTTGPSIKTNQQKTMYKGMMADIAVRYQELVNLGVEIEDARGILPTNIATNIVAKINLRTLSDMARSRTGGRTQDEYRQIMDKMIAEVISVHPWAHMFLFPKGKGFFDEIEEYAKETVGDDRNALLKIIDKMRKAL